jgi:hypothetical protein
MGQTPSGASDHPDDSDFIFYPTNKVVGFIDDPGDAKAALDDLMAAGFTADQIEVLTGEAGAHRIDAKGEQHGLVARIVRNIQRAGTWEPVHVKRHEQEMLEGHFGFGVTAKALEQREQVREILKSHNGHFIYFYGEWAIEELAP